MSRRCPAFHEAISESSVLKSQSNGRAPEDRDFRRLGQVAVERLENVPRVIHGGKASRFATGLRV
jgi:hypothetical protein